MSVKSSSLSNDSLLHPDLSAINFNIPLYMYCLRSRPGVYIFTSYSLISVLLILPLCIFIIYHGLQEWREKRFTSSAATMSHSDSFTYNKVTMELIRIFGSLLCCCAIYSDHFNIVTVGTFLSIFTWYGEVFFHTLTCVERYLAVVHPITYLNLRKERGIRIRNICIGCVWLLSVVGMSLVMTENVITIVNWSLLTFFLSIVLYCSVSVLCVLIRPGPVEQGRGRKRVDQSKQRAFYTIMVILGVLVLRVAWDLIWSVLYVLESGLGCVIMACGVWFNALSSLVLPLLFLHKAEKLCCKKNIQ